MAKKKVNYEEIDKYVEDCLNLAFNYEKNVLNNFIIVSDWIVKAVNREHTLRSKYVFDLEQVKEVFKFLYFVNIEPKKRFQPLPFQAWIILCIYSLYREDGRRLRKYGIVWIARKNGKTAFTSVLSLYEMMKGESEAEVYFLATTARQASQGLKYLKSIIDYSPALKKRIDVLQYNLRYNKHSILRPLANNASKLDGLNPSFAVIDESHSHPNRDLFNIIDSGTKARKNPLIMEISTAGFNKDYPFYNQLEIGKKVLNDELIQDNTFYAFYTLDSEEEIENSNMWIKSNPTIGHILNIDALQEDWEKAIKTGTEKDNFIVKNLNYYKDIAKIWIPDEIYKGCFIDYDFESLKGSKVYLGIDLAATRDLTSLAILIENKGEFFVKVEHFLPKNQSSIIRMNGLDLTDWIERGLITQTDTHTTDYNYIIDRIRYYTENFEVVALGYDKWNSSHIINEIQLDLGVYSKACIQNASFFNYPLRQLEGMIYDKKIKLSKNPVLRWMFRNVVLYRDSNDNLKVMKNKANDSVDSVVALLMALGMYLEYKIIE